METNNITTEHTLDQLLEQKEAMSKQYKDLSKKAETLKSDLDKLNSKINVEKQKAINDKNYQEALKHKNKLYYNVDDKDYFIITDIYLLNQERYAVEFLSIKHNQWIYESRKINTTPLLSDIIASSFKGFLGKDIIQVNPSEINIDNIIEETAITLQAKFKEQLSKI